MTKPTTTAKAIGCRAKNARRRRDSGSKGLPQRSLTLGILVETRNPPTASPSDQPHRVSITDSFGASPASSAMDHSARRDPGGASSTLTRFQMA
jgi:hypothetical protein